MTELTRVSYIEIEKLQDEFHCDLDPDYIVGDIFSDGSTVVAVVSEEAARLLSNGSRPAMYRSYSSSSKRRASEILPESSTKYQRSDRPTVRNSRRSSIWMTSNNSGNELHIRNGHEQEPDAPTGNTLAYPPRLSPPGQIDYDNKPRYDTTPASPDLLSPPFNRYNHEARSLEANKEDDHSNGTIRGHNELELPPPVEAYASTDPRKSPSPQLAEESPAGLEKMSVFLPPPVSGNAIKSTPRAVSLNNSALPELSPEVNKSPVSPTRRPSSEVTLNGTSQLTEPKLNFRPSPAGSPIYTKHPIKAPFSPSLNTHVSNSENGSSKDVKAAFSFPKAGNSRLRKPLAASTPKAKTKQNQSKPVIEEFIKSDEEIEEMDIDVDEDTVVGTTGPALVANTKKVVERKTPAAKGTPILASNSTKVDITTLNKPSNKLSEAKSTTPLTPKVKEGDIFSLPSEDEEPPKTTKPTAKRVVKPRTRAAKTAVKTAAKLKEDSVVEAVAKPKENSIVKAAAKLKEGSNAKTVVAKPKEDLTAKATKPVSTSAVTGNTRKTPASKANTSTASAKKVTKLKPSTVTKPTSTAVKPTSTQDEQVVAKTVETHTSKPTTADNTAKAYSSFSESSGSDSSSGSESESESESSKTVGLSRQSQPQNGPPTPMKQGSSAGTKTITPSRFLEVDSNPSITQVTAKVNPPPKGVPAKTVPPKGVAPKTVTPKTVPPKSVVASTGKVAQKSEPLKKIIATPTSTQIIPSTKPTSGSESESGSSSDSGDESDVSSSPEPTKRLRAVNTPVSVKSVVGGPLSTIAARKQLLEQATAANSSTPTGIRPKRAIATRSAQLAQDVNAVPSTAPTAAPTASPAVTVSSKSVINSKSALSSTPAAAVVQPLWGSQPAPPKRIAGLGSLSALVGRSVPDVHEMTAGRMSSQAAQAAAAMKPTQEAKKNGAGGGISSDSSGSSSSSSSSSSDDGDSDSSDDDSSDDDNEAHRVLSVSASASKAKIGSQNGAAKKKRKNSGFMGLLREVKK